MVLSVLVLLPFTDILPLLRLSPTKEVASILSPAVSLVWISSRLRLNPPRELVIRLLPTPRRRNFRQQPRWRRARSPRRRQVASQRAPYRSEEITRSSSSSRSPHRRLNNSLRDGRRSLGRDETISSATPSLVDTAKTTRRNSGLTLQRIPGGTLRATRAQRWSGQKCRSSQIASL